MHYLLEILIPHFVTENVAVLDLPEGYHIVCVEDVLKYRPGIKYDKIIKVRSLSFFGHGLFPKVVED